LVSPSMSPIVSHLEGSSASMSRSPMRSSKAWRENA
jgi:hypothetical protein